MKSLLTIIITLFSLVALGQDNMSRKFRTRTKTNFDGKYNDTKVVEGVFKISRKKALNGNQWIITVEGKEYRCQGTATRPENENVTFLMDKDRVRITIYTTENDSIRKIEYLYER